MPHAVLAVRPASRCTSSPFCGVPIAAHAAAICPAVPAALDRRPYEPCEVIMRARHAPIGLSAEARSPRAIAWRDLAPEIRRHWAVVEFIPAWPITAADWIRYLTLLTGTLHMTLLNGPMTYVAEGYGVCGWLQWAESGAHGYGWNRPIIACLAPSSYTRAAPSTSTPRPPSPLSSSKSRTAGLPPPTSTAPYLAPCHERAR
jgi:hypothetical protein